MAQTVLITGATSGIGRACARRFADGGYRLILTGRREERLEAIAQSLRAAGTEVYTLPFDVRDRDACRQAVKSIYKIYGIGNSYYP